MFGNMAAVQTTITIAGAKYIHFFIWVLGRALYSMLGYKKTLRIPNM